MLDPISVHFAGCCGPDNPGGAGGWAFIVKEGDKIIGQKAGRVSPADGNTELTAEYTALLEAFAWLFERKLQGAHVRFYGSKRVIISQLTEVWDVDQALADWYAQARNRARKFTDIGFTLATKSQNADVLALAKDEIRPFSTKR